MPMRHIPIDSPIFSPQYRGKCYYVESANGPDGDPVYRYLQMDGGWGETAYYFDNEEQIEKALLKGEKPDFTLSQRQLEDRYWRLMEYNRIVSSTQYVIPKYNRRVLFPFTRRLS